MIDSVLSSGRMLPMKKYRRENDIFSLSEGNELKLEPDKFRFYFLLKQDSKKKQLHETFSI